MPKEYTKEELWKLYEKLPEELKEAVFSVDTADNIWNTCERNNIETVSEISKLVGNVLLGILSPSEFQKSLETELKLELSVAKKVFQEIHRQIFYPVQIELSKLYPTETMPTATISTPAAPKAPAKPGAPASSEEKPVGEKGEDTYRETIE